MIYRRQWSAIAITCGVAYYKRYKYQNYNVMWKPTSEVVEWDVVKSELLNFNREFIEIVDKLKEKPPIYKLLYPYGFTISDKDNFYFPDLNGEIKSIKNEIMPYCILADKSIEVFLESDNRCIPDTLYYKKGDVFPKISNTGQENTKTRPPSPYNWVSGVRNLIITPMNSRTKYYSDYSDKYDLSEEINPERAQDHFYIFNKVLSKVSKKEWFTKVYAFDKQWTDKIKNDKNWDTLKFYFLREEIEAEKFRANTIFLEYALNEILLNNKISLKPYTIELLKEICYVALKAMPAYKPTVNEGSLPYKEFVSDYLASYSDKYIPVIYEVAYLNKKYEKLYLPLSVSDYFLSDKKSFRGALYLQELSKNIKTIFKGLSNHALTRNTGYAHLNENIELEYYSAQGGKGGIKSSEELFDNDDRFTKIKDKYFSLSQHGFPKRTLFNQSLVAIKLIK